MLIIFPFAIFSNDWEMDIDGLLMSIISGYEKNSAIGTLPINMNEYYDDSGRVLLRIKFGKNGVEYWRDLYKYDDEGREIYNSSWSKVRTPDWKINGFMETEYHSEEDDLITIESGMHFYRKIKKSLESNILSIENTAYINDEAEVHSFIEYTYEKLDNGYIRQYQKGDNISRLPVDFLYDSDQKLLERIVRNTDSELIDQKIWKYNSAGQKIEENYTSQHRNVGVVYSLRIIDGKHVIEEFTDEEMKKVHSRNQSTKYEYDNKGRLYSTIMTIETDSVKRLEEYLTYKYFKQDGNGRYFADD